MDVTAIFIGPPTQGLINPRGTLSQIARLQWALQSVRQAGNRQQQHPAGAGGRPAEGSRTGAMDWDMDLTSSGRVDLCRLQLSPERSVDSGKSSDTEQSVQREEGQSRFEASFYVEYLAPLVTYFRLSNRGCELGDPAVCSVAPIGGFSRNMQWVDPNGRFFDRPTRQEVYLYWSSMRSTIRSH